MFAVASRSSVSPPPSARATSALALLALLCLLFLAGCTATPEPGPAAVAPDASWEDTGEGFDVAPDDVLEHDTQEPAPAQVAYVEVEPHPARVEVNGTLQLTATAYDDTDAPIAGRGAQWRSSDPTVAEVTASGLVLGRTIGHVLVTATIAGVEGTASVQVTGKPVASVELVPARRTLNVGDTIVMDVTLRDAGRAILEDARPVAWESSDEAVVTVDTDGLVRAIGPGEALVTATVEGVSASSEFTVVAPADGYLRITTAVRRIVRDDTVQLVATAYDEHGAPLSGRTIEWESTNEAVATIDAGGLLRALAPGTVQVRATSEALSDSVELEVHFEFGAVHAGGNFTCGLVGGRTYCWGQNDHGQLGRGSAGAGPGAPARIQGGVEFVALALGQAHACGLTATDVAYCWGRGTGGRLGTGSEVDHNVPTPVAGTHRFTAIAAGRDHTCAIDRSGRAWCWGDNTAGKLGTGSTTASTAPVAVSGTREYIAIAAGGDHTCAIDRTNVAYCWGSNAHGQAGTNQATTRYTSPTPVTGGYDFAVIAAGDRHTCGIATSGMVACFGANDRGQLGTASTTEWRTPVMVSMPAGVSFSRLALGDDHGCGQAPGGRLYCFGAGTNGQLGVGQAGDHGTPQAVTHTPSFVAFAAGAAHACAISDTGQPHCWGAGSNGQLGTRTNDALVPVVVEGL